MDSAVLKLVVVAYGWSAAIPWHWQTLEGPSCSHARFVCQGATTACHYDMNQNIFLQLHGAKRRGRRLAGRNTALPQKTGWRFICPAGLLQSKSPSSFPSSSFIVTGPFPQFATTINCVPWWCFFSKDHSGGQHGPERAGPQEAESSASESTSSTKKTPQQQSENKAQQA